MPSINMIAPRRAERARLERDMRRLVVVILVELVCAVGLGGWVCTRILTTRNRIADLDVQLARLQPVVRQIEGYENDTKKLVPKMQLLNQAKDQTMTWYNVLDGLTQSFPQSTYLTRLSTNVADKNDAAVQMNLTGVSTTQAKIGETMVRLHSVPDLEAVELHFTGQTTVDKVDALEFEIGTRLKSKEPPKGAKPNVGSQS